MAQLKKPTIKNPELVAAMAEFKQRQTPQNESEMLDILKEASLIAPVTLQGKLEDAKVDENGQRQMQATFMAVSNPEGDKFFPAFTDWLEFLKWKNDPDADTMVVTFDQYCDLLIRRGIDIRGIVINPAETSIVIRREKMAELKGVELPKPETDRPELTVTKKPGGAPSKPHTILPLFGTEKVANPELILASNALRQENSEAARNKLVLEMRKARFVAPVLMDMPKEVHPGEKINAKAEFIMLNHEGGKFLPLFTSLPELQKWTGAPDCKAVPMTLTNYIAMLSDPKNSAAGIVVDPFTMGLAFNKQQALALQPRVELRDLETVPDGMKEDLQDHLATISEVKAAYLDGMRTNGTDGYLVVVELADGTQAPPILENIGQTLKKYGSCVVAPVKSPLGEKVVERQEAFYRA